MKIINWIPYKEMKLKDYDLKILLEIINDMQDRITKLESNSNITPFHNDLTDPCYSNDIWLNK